MIMTRGRFVPDPISKDERQVNRFRVRLAEALSACMDESEWKKFAVLHGLTEQITEHPRFLRSLKWGDEDHEGCVLDLVTLLYDKKQDALIELFERSSIQKWFQNNAADLLDLWDAGSDPLIDAIVRSLGEVDAVSNVINLREHANRIKNALPGDPYLAIGATKDMLEAAMRTILFQRGVSDVEKLDYPSLTARCFAELGLSANSAPTTEEERHRRKIASAAKSMLIAANELRNRAGAGHGRVVGEEQNVSATDASLVASTGLTLAAWLLRHAGIK